MYRDTCLFCFPSPRGRIWGSSVFSHQFHRYSAWSYDPFQWFIILDKEKKKKFCHRCYYNSKINFSSKGSKNVLYLFVIPQNSTKDFLTHFTYYTSNKGFWFSGTLGISWRSLNKLLPTLAWFRLQRNPLNFKLWSPMAQNLWEITSMYISGSDSASRLIYSSWLF